MDTVDRNRRAAIAAARDAAGKARGLAEGLEALARALDTMAVELPPAGSPDAGVGEPLARGGGLWTAAEVARHLKTRRSWVDQATASGRLPSVRVGHMRRFDPAKIRTWPYATGSPSVSTEPDQARNQFRRQYARHSRSAHGTGTSLRPRVHPAQPS
jgi:excisionase family DNA binding protein